MSSLNGTFAGGSMGDELGAKKLSESEVTSLGGLRLPFAGHWPVWNTGATMRSVLKRIPALASPTRYKTASVAVKPNGSETLTQHGEGGITEDVQSEGQGSVPSDF